MGQDMKAAPEKDERARENIWVYWTFPRIVQFHPRTVPDIKKKNIYISKKGKEAFYGQMYILDGNDGKEHQQFAQKDKRNGMGLIYLSLSYKMSQVALSLGYV